MEAVLEAVHCLTLIAKPSLHIRRWWTSDRTQLQRVHTYWRNQARAQRRAGRLNPATEEKVKEAAKQFHNTARRQRKSHWDNFLAEDCNI